MKQRRDVNTCGRIGGAIAVFGASLFTRDERRQRIAGAIGCAIGQGTQTLAEFGWRMTSDSLMFAPRALKAKLRDNGTDWPFGWFYDHFGEE